MEKITLVTAFFDIGRGDYKDFQRSSEKYINWFSRWARMKNKLIVYLDDDIIIEKVKQIRDSYGLGENTIIEKINNVYEIEEEVLNQWIKIEKSNEFINYRDFKENPENKAKYNYINLIKSYFMSEVAKNYVDEGYVSWLDFGFEHGGAVYENENDYDFEWKYDFGNKINLFYLNEITTNSVFKIVKELGPDCISGGTLVCPKELANEFWKLNLESAKILAEIGFMDDDQLIYLMSYRRKPNLFDLHKCDWFMALHDFGGEHFKVKQKVEIKLTFFQRLKSKIKRGLKKLYGKK